MYSKVEAAYLILKDYKRPLHLREIINVALKKKMIQTEGKTPWSTLGADFHNENKRRTRRGESLRFCRIDEGEWGLVEWGLTPVEKKREKKSKT